MRQTEGDTRDTIITLGKQLSRRWYVGYERGVQATTGTWQLIYRVAQRFTLRAQSGSENAIAFMAKAPQSPVRPLNSFVTVFSAPTGPRR